MTPGGELRQNVLTGAWVVVAPGRERRPVETSPPIPVSPSDRDDCPFCPGNEDRLAAILEERPGRTGEPWGVRVVPNRFPAVGTSSVRSSGPSPSVLESTPPTRPAGPLPALGRHEVIVESPVHDRRLGSMAPDELERAVGAWRDRYAVALRENPGGPVFLFRNRGRGAGASLFHPHTQLVAMEATPPRVRLLEARSADWQARHGSCLVCDLPGLEPDWEARVVDREGDVVAVVPWAPETDLEVWIVPGPHRAELSEATDMEVGAAARLLGRVLGRLRDHAGDPPHNLLLHSLRGGPDTARRRHWFLRVRPRASQIAGFELSTDLRMVSADPVAVAARLRGEEADS